MSGEIGRETSKVAVREKKITNKVAGRTKYIWKLQ